MFIFLSGRPGAKYLKCTMSLYFTAIPEVDPIISMLETGSSVQLHSQSSVPLCQDVLVECTTCPALGKGPDAHFLHKSVVRTVSSILQMRLLLARCSPHLPFVPQTWGPPSSRYKGALGVLISTIVEHARCDALTCQSFEEPSVFSFFRIRNNFREICCGRPRSWALSLQCVSVSVYILKTYPAYDSLDLLIFHHQPGIRNHCL